MSKVKAIPRFIAKIYGSARKFRQAKRSALRKTLREFSELTMGCAHTPAYESIREARSALEDVESLLSIENWGR